MQFVDLKTQQSRIRKKIEDNIQNVLNHGKYIMGPEINQLEEKLAKYCQVKYAVGVASGTDALLMPLMAYGVGPGDAIFTTPFTFIATAEVIRLLGATPVFVDIDEKTFNIDPEQLKAVINKTVEQGKLKAKGILPVDLFGQPADYDEINKIAREHNMFVIEDAAQSFGASYKNKMACSLADVASTSFFPAKPLGAYGDGGMIFTDHQDLYEKLVSIRIHGKGSHKYNNIRVGINGRLDTIQAAILLAKMEIFDEEIKLRQLIANRYSEPLKDLITVPFIKEGNVSAWAQYALIHPKRDQILTNLKNNNIPSAIYYPIPLHLQEAFESLDYKRGDFPIAEKCADQIFSVPFHPYLDRDDQAQIVSAIKTAV